MRHVVVAVLLVTNIAVADDAPARKLFEQGREVQRQGRDQEACELFAKSFALDPAPDTRLDLAACAQLTGDFARARELYVQALREAELSQDDLRASFARNKVNELDRGLAAAAMPVVVVPPAVETPASSARQHVQKRRSWVHASWVMAGAGAASWATSLGVCLYAKSRWNDAVARPFDPAAIAQGNDAKALAHNMTWVFAGGAALFAGAAYAYLKAPEDWVDVEPVLTSNSAGLSLSGRF